MNLKMKRTLPNFYYHKVSFLINTYKKRWNKPRLFLFYPNNEIYPLP
nr:MAG TPA: hypothetical protein [Caudoviricetes sp.]